MRGASMLIQPSLYEGFGIPPLESLFLGTPVVLSNIPVFKELYANLDVCFYDLESTHQLAEYMLNGVEKNLLILFYLFSLIIDMLQMLY